MILYQILMALALPILVAHAVLTGGALGLRQRLGRVGTPQGGPRLWVHGASVGELTSARWVIEALCAARPGLQVLVTANSLTGRDMVTGWAMVGVSAALAPFDSAGAAGRLLDRWQPQALVIVENELWPARIAAAYRRGVPVLVIGARISARSARRWHGWPGLMQGLLAQIDWISAQDDASAARLVELGLPNPALGPTFALKSLARAAAAPAPFAAPAVRDACLLAASTHEGEEALVLKAFGQARGNGGPQVLILAPRHPKRGGEVADLIEQSGLGFARRSKGQVPTAEHPVFLADTLGEMPLWYGMAGICLIGGTFAPRGGHTPFEPAQFGCALLHGPSVFNFAAQFAALDRDGAAVALRGADDLAATLQNLNAARQAAMALGSTATLAPFADGAAEILVRLLRALPMPVPLRD